MLVHVPMLFYGDACTYARLCSSVNKLENVAFLWTLNMNLLTCKRTSTSKPYVINQILQVHCLYLSYKLTHYSTNENSDVVSRRIVFMNLFLFLIILILPEEIRYLYIECF